MTYEEIAKLLDHEAKYLLTHRCENLPKDLIYQVNPNQVREIFSQSDRSQSVIENLKNLWSWSFSKHRLFINFTCRSRYRAHRQFSFYKNLFILIQKTSLLSFRSRK